MTQIALSYQVKFPFIFKDFEQINEIVVLELLKIIFRI